MSIGQGSVKTYVVENDLGTPIELGIAMDPGSTQGLLDAEMMYDYIVALPDGVNLPPFKHIMINWNPRG